MLCFCCCVQAVYIAVIQEIKYCTPGQTTRFGSHEKKAETSTTTSHGVEHIVNNNCCSSAATCEGTTPLLYLVHAFRRDCFKCKHMFLLVEAKNYMRRYATPWFLSFARKQNMWCICPRSRWFFLRNVLCFANGRASLPRYRTCLLSAIARELASQFRMVLRAEAELRRLAGGSTRAHR